jgi:hypothetical protein
LATNRFKHLASSSDGAFCFMKLDVRADVRRLQQWIK